MNDRALKVMEQYELEIISTRRGRGSYIFETPQGLRILCDYAGSENKALFQNRVMEKIREGGYAKVDLLLPNKEGSLISKDRDENRYVLKEWYVGRECDTSNENEILAAVGNLARLHRLMHLSEAEEFRKSFTAQPLQQEIRARNAELRKIRSFVRKKNAKQEFERLFLECFDRYYEQASQAEEALAQLGCDPEAEYRPEGICHGDYNHHHVLMSGYDIATTNFECCRFDEQVNDLYRFMRKILEKNDWNQRLGMRMLEQYAQVRPIPLRERQILYIRMLYPEKFRKLANHYYGSNKAWISGRFLEKLNNLNRQEKAKNNFVKMLQK
jgi:CotS family spore coat protein